MAPRSRAGRQLSSGDKRRREWGAGLGEGPEPPAQVPDPCLGHTVLESWGGWARWGMGGALRHPRPAAGPLHGLHVPPAKSNAAPDRRDRRWVPPGLGRALGPAVGRLPISQTSLTLGTVHTCTSAREPAEGQAPRAPHPPHRPAPHPEPESLLGGERHGLSLWEEERKGPGHRGRAPTREAQAESRPRLVCHLPPPRPQRTEPPPGAWARQGSRARAGRRGQQGTEGRRHSPEPPGT